MTENETRRPLVCLLAAAETSPSVLYGLYDVLSTAGAMYGEVTSGKTGDEVLDVRIVAATKEPFRCFGEILIEPHDGLEAIDEADAINVCDMFTPGESRNHWSNDPGDVMAPVSLAPSEPIESPCCDMNRL